MDTKDNHLSGYTPVDLQPNRADVMGGSSSSPSKEKTNFLKAARSGNLQGVHEYLKQGGDVNAANENGLTALHFACKEGKLGLVNDLLSRGALVDSVTVKGNTPLHVACLAGHLEIVRILLQYRAIVNTQSTDGFTPLAVALQQNHQGVVKVLLETDPNSTAQSGKEK